MRQLVIFQRGFKIKPAFKLKERILTIYDTLEENDAFKYSGSTVYDSWTKVRFVKGKDARLNPKNL